MAIITVIIKYPGMTIENEKESDAKLLRIQGAALHF